ncbi:MAG: Phosphoenolpyruvate synthase [Microgenomates group bacterium GW2011_GWA1_48_10]|nr:MAG: Phosphoenolpyruvate synthase [Microgenomates group bacterium GW2011_GWA1_48_10]
MSSYCLPFENVGKEDTPVVGGKGANLGEMASFGMPVPPGFVVTAKAYRDFLEKGQLKPKMEEILKGLDVEDSEKLQQASKRVKELLITAPIPEEISREIVESYQELWRKLSSKQSRFHSLLQSLGMSRVRVAVRSSATSEDSKEASFAGQNETFLNIAGENEVVTAVRRCWASLFEGRSIFYRVQNHFDHFESAIAVVVQTMVQSEVSGILFSIDPVTNNHERIVVETVWGLGEFIVQGKVTPDHYEVNKGDLLIVEKKVAEQKIMLTRSLTGTVKEAKVPADKQRKIKLTDEQIRKIAELSKKLEEHYHFPQDSEFAVSAGELYLVQTRPITTTEKGVVNTEDLQKQLAGKKVLLSGAPASPGIVSGRVKVLHSAKEIGKIKAGDILVAPQTNPDFVPAMKKAAAIVTDSGGRTSHAAIVSRELGIPCVVGTEKATKTLRSGTMVTVQGSEGRVYAGEITVHSSRSTAREKPAGEKVATKTKVYVNLAEPEKAKEIAALPCDGVGLLRAEFVLAGMGVHPKQAIAEHKEKEFTEKLAAGLRTFAEAFYPRPVVYRATDFKTNEYRSLRGGDKFEPHEENPMIGFRGAFRYMQQPEVFKMEIDAIRIIREKEGFKNLWLMIPFCRTIKELEETKALINKFGLTRSEGFKLWMMCEIPSNVILLEEFIKVGIDGISVGSNDLTMLTLGVDRDNETVASEYSELDKSMLISFEKIVKSCKKMGVTCSMCGQAPSDYPQLTEKLVEWGITSVSVNPDVVFKTREIVAEAERKL